MRRRLFELHRRAHAPHRERRADGRGQDPVAGAEVIYAYTRKDALNDGVRIDLSEVGLLQKNAEDVKGGAGKSYPAFRAVA